MSSQAKVSSLVLPSFPSWNWVGEDGEDGEGILHTRRECLPFVFWLPEVILTISISHPPLPKLVSVPEPDLYTFDGNIDYREGYCHRYYIDEP